MTSASAIRSIVRSGIAALWCKEDRAERAASAGDEPKTPMRWEPKKKQSPDRASGLHRAAIQYCGDSSPCSGLWSTGFAACTRSFARTPCTGGQPLRSLIIGVSAMDLKASSRSRLPRVREVQHDE